MRTGTLIFLCLTGFFSSAFCATFGGIIYVSDKITLSDFRDYCRQNYTPLISNNNQEELLILGKDTGNASTTIIFNKGWIGLYKDVNGTWRWSGGKDALEALQGIDVDHSCVIQNEKGWLSVNCEEQFPFYCFQSSLFLVKENKTWEAALEHCRSLNMQLVNPYSEFALNPVLQTSRMALTAQVWTGLRYLGDSWLWVDRTYAGYKTWYQEGISQCPDSSHHCGALSVESQQLDSWDCADKFNFVCY